ncbi:hypothetical protein CVT24_005621 [Panaeolus cyanescens]|uniref:Uncharacterized protein n=1 Tax=Panaeolus cyanescens TaxID=181874 RepID=A0A409YXX5_9AGAR|nr:hypothetical protein CVT24_005621 [Panaeolus cyanescens]
MQSAKQRANPVMQDGRPSLSNRDPKANKYDGDLNDDLHKAFSGDFNFTGTYYHRSVESDAPNPGLTIEGLGLIGSPPSERDIAAIVSLSAPAPPKKGRKKPTNNTTVQTIVEIEPAKVSFANPAWAPFVQKVITQKVWKTLGLAPFTTRPKCELYKLLLYQKGAQGFTSSMSSTAKADGMFATVIVVLPSAFEGGQVHVSHAGATTVLDISKESTFSTSVLAWYTDVVQEVKPLTAGYRLALSYNLIHTSPDTPKPALPVMPEGPLKRFRDTLQRWKDGGYSEDRMPTPRLFAVMLEKSYGHVDFVPGLTTLKGRDAFLISNLLPIATEMGFVFCVSNLERKITGQGGSYGCDYAYNKRRRYGLCAYDFDDFEEDLEEPTDIDVVEEDEVSISNVIRITANEAVNLIILNYPLSGDALVPRKAFDGLSPDDKNPDNWLGKVEHRYYRSALLIYKQEDEISILMSIGGSYSALQSLPLTKTPSAQTRAVIDMIVSGGLHHAAAAAVLRHALLWKDHGIWNRTFPYVDLLDVVQTAIVEAKNVFGLDAILPGLSACLKRRRTLEDRLAVTKTVATHCPQGMSAPWIQSMLNDALVSYSSALAVDVPILVQLALDSKDGLAKLATIVIPNTASNHESYDFHIALSEALDARKQQMANATAKTSQHQIDTLNSLVRQSLMAAGSQWSGQVSPSGGKDSSNNKPTLSPTVLGERINQLVKLCFSTGNPETCVEIGKNVGPERQMDLLAAIKTHVGSVIPGWVKELMACVLSAYSTPALSHVPTLSWIAEALGAQHIDALISTKIPKSETYEFLFTLAKALQERRSLLLRDKNATEETKMAYRTAVYRCINLFVSQWEVGLRTRSPYEVLYGYSAGPNAKVKRILQIVEFSFDTLGRFTPCTILFQNLLHAELSTGVAKRFEDIHTPLVPLLKEVLTKHKKDILLEPFKSFFKGTICLYLGHILRAVRSAPIPALPAAIGCSCPHCKSLQAFLCNSAPSLNIQAAKDNRTHVEKFITGANVGHIITFTTVKHGVPHTLCITKRPETLAGFKWKEARLKALNFMRGIAGNDETLKKLMEERYEDVMKTLSGAKFVVGQLSIHGSAPTATATATSTTVPVRSASTHNASVAPVAGEKRKRGPTISGTK